MASHHKQQASENGDHVQHHRLSSAYNVVVIALASTNSVTFSTSTSVFNSEFTRSFASFALLIGPLWFFGFGAAEMLKPLPRRQRIAIAGALALPYFVL